MCACARGVWLPQRAIDRPADRHAALNALEHACGVGGGVSPRPSVSVRLHSTLSPTDRPGSAAQQPARAQFHRKSAFWLLRPAPAPRPVPCGRSPTRCISFISSHRARPDSRRPTGSEAARDVPSRNCSGSSASARGLPKCASRAITRQAATHQGSERRRQRRVLACAGESRNDVVVWGRRGRAGWQCVWR
jgi:hypothetical protein